MSETTTTGTLRCDKCGREPLPAGEQYPCGLDGAASGEGGFCHWCCLPRISGHYRRVATEITTPFAEGGGSKASGPLYPDIGGTIADMHGQPAPQPDDALALVEYLRDSIRDAYERLGMTSVEVPICDRLTAAIQRKRLTSVSTACYDDEVAHCCYTGGCAHGHN